MRRFSLPFLAIAALTACTAERGAFPNRMAKASSGYLARAARQPVSWQSWGREAFALAARLDRPVLLYIGADECGWCERMDRESYDDAVLGALIDSLFVPIRVDRDERPDVARRYQAALQSLAGLRGYPVTLFLTPDGSAFFGGTYFPRDDPVTGRGLRQLLPEVARTYRDHRETIVRHAALVRQLAVAGAAESHGVLHPELVVRELAAVRRDIEATLETPAGLTTFPRGQAIALLLDDYVRTQDAASLRLASTALRRVADQAGAVGGAGADGPSDVGRAQLARNVAVAWVLTADPQFREWGRTLVRGLAAAVAPDDPQPLFADRRAYVIAGLIDAAPAVGDTAAAQTARAALDRLLDRVYVPGEGVRHALSESVAGLLQDQVQVAIACLAAHRAFGDPGYLEVARDLAGVLNRDYADPRGGYFDAARVDPAAPALADRTKQVFDDLLPGANAWAARLLLRLAEADDNPRYRKLGLAALAAFVGAVEGEGPRAASYVMAARDALAGF